MRILVVYLFWVIIGQAVAVGIGLALDPFSKTAALAVFIPVYYAMYWVAWRITLLMVDRTPSAEPADKSGGDNAKAALWLLTPVGLALELCD